MGEMRDPSIEWADWAQAISERRLRPTTFGGACLSAFIYATEALTGTADRVREARERLAQDLLRDDARLRWTQERISRTVRGLRPLSADELDHLLTSSTPLAQLFREELRALWGSTPLLYIAEKTPPKTIPREWPVMMDGSTRGHHGSRGGTMAITSKAAASDHACEAHLRAELIAYRARLLAAEEWAAARRWASALEAVESAMRLSKPSPRHDSGSTLYTDAVREVLRYAAPRALSTDEIFAKASALIKRRAPSAPPLERQQMARMLNRMGSRVVNGAPCPLVEKVAARRYRWVG